MAVGRPIKLTPNVARKTVSITATASQTTFTPTGGYRIGDLAVYRNGVRLVNGRDYTAVDGANVILQSGASLDDVLEFGIFDSFNVADAIGANGNQSMGGDLTVGLTTLYSGTTGIVSTTYFYGDGSNLTGVAATDNINTNNIAISGIATVGTSITMNDSGVNCTGVITATSFEGDGSKLSNVISGVEIKLDGTSVGTAATVLNFGPGFSTATPVSSGISTIETTRTLTIGVRSGTAVTFSISGGSFNVSGRSGNVAIDV